MGSRRLDRRAEPADPVRRGADVRGRAAARPRSDRRELPLVRARSDRQGRARAAVRRRAGPLDQHERARAHRRLRGGTDARGARAEQRLGWSHLATSFGGARPSTSASTTRERKRPHPVDRGRAGRVARRRGAGSPAARDRERRAAAGASVLHDRGVRGEDRLAGIRQARLPAAQAGRDGGLLPRQLQRAPCDERPPSTRRERAGRRAHGSQDAAPDRGTPPPPPSSPSPRGSVSRRAASTTARGGAIGRGAAALHRSARCAAARSSRAARRPAQGWPG